MTRQQLNSLLDARDVFFFFFPFLLPQTTSVFHLELIFPQSWPGSNTKSGISPRHTTMIYQYNPTLILIPTWIPNNHDKHPNQIHSCQNQHGGLFPEQSPLAARSDDKGSPALLEDMSHLNNSYGLRFVSHRQSSSPSCAPKPASTPRPSHRFPRRRQARLCLPCARASSMGSPAPESPRC